MALTCSGLWLASGSPRRRALAQWLGLPVQVGPVPVDETPRANEPPRAYVQRLARAKAHAAQQRAPASFIILAADTAVVDQGRILGKPRDAADAVRMLRTLAGRPHEVMTGFALLWPAAAREHVDVVVTHVHMRSMDDAEIRAYVATGDPLDKAGAYAAQNTRFRPVARVEGCFANVVGLPVCAVARVLMRWGCPPVRGIVARCAQAFGYNCSIGLA
ncbi:MAG: septum formation protein Maf [Chloroflexi bacterium]|nr:septum formation protein Maf [Chloroflexota bacterium]